MVIVFTNMNWACTTVSNSYTSYWRRIGSFEKAHTQTHTHRDTYTHRIQTHSNTHADTHTDTHKQWDTHIQTHIQKNTTNSHTWKHRQTNRQTDRQTDRHTHTHTHTQPFISYALISSMAGPLPNFIFANASSSILELLLNKSIFHLCYPRPN